MKNFFNGFFSLFHPKTFNIVIKNYKLSILLFLLTFFIFSGVSYFFIKLFENVVIKNIINSLTRKWIYLSSLKEINEFIKNPLTDFFYPYILYISYIFSMIILSIFSGSILDILSKKTQKLYPYECTYVINRNGVKKFFFNLFEELKLLSFNITFIVGLFFLSYLTGIGTTQSKIVHYFLLYLVLIITNGLIFLAYSYLRWGHSYLTTTKIAFKKSGKLIGHGLIITLYFYLISLLIKNIPYTTLSFCFLFALNALILPLAVVSGTNNAIYYAKNIDKFPCKKGILAKVFETIIIILTLIIIITGIEIYLKSKTNLALMKCKYSVENLKIELNENESDTIDSILKKLKIKSNPEITFILNITNTTSKDIQIFDFYINIYLNKKDIASLKINRFKLEKNSSNSLNIKSRIDLKKISFEFIKQIIKKQKINFQIIGNIVLDLWLGKIPIKFLILNT